MEHYMGLFRSERVGDRGSDVAGPFAVRKGRLQIWMQRAVGSRKLAGVGDWAGAIWAIGRFGQFGQFG
eukprot:scaffold18847_cov99-Amphora_coffeaeformis.AAC.1